MNLYPKQIDYSGTWLYPLTFIPAVCFVLFFGYSLTKLFANSVNKLVIWVLVNLGLYSLIAFGVLNSFKGKEEAIPLSIVSICAFLGVSPFLFMIANSFIFKLFSQGIYRNRAWWLIGFSNGLVKVVGSIILMFIFIGADLPNMSTLTLIGKLPYYLMVPVILEVFGMWLSGKYIYCTENYADIRNKDFFFKSAFFTHAPL